MDEEEVAHRIVDEAVDEETLATWTKKELVIWLVNHRQKKSGNKQILIKRILRTVQFDDTDSDCETDTDNVSDEIPDISSVKSEWQPLATDNCPPTRSEDVENYFIYNKNPVSGKTQACHRQLKKARKFAKEGYVYDMDYNGLDNSNYCLIKAKCKPSMKELVTVECGQLARYYSLHAVLIKSTGRIEGGKCNCKTGLTGLCSHIGGLLITVVQIKNACTTKGCEWLRPQTDLQLKPQRLRDIKFSSNEEAPIKPHPEVYQAGPCQDPERFLEDIMAGLGKVYPQSVLYQTINPEITDVSDVISKYKPPFKYDDSVDLSSTVCQSEFRNFAAGIEVSDKEIERVEKSTKGQSANPIWKDVRTNILTASNFASICKKRPETKPDNLVGRLRGNRSNFDGKPLQYGRKKESQARRDYTQHHMKQCGRVNVEKTGLMISQDFPFLGASVDGLVRCDKCGLGVLEIKCPYNNRKTTPREHSQVKSSCLEIRDGKLKLKDNHDYMYQIMGQMKVLGLDWCDFVVWTKKGIHVERVTFSQDFWENKMLFQLKFFYNSFFLAECFTDRIKRGIDLFHSD
ncbi:uncharacterized protein LOC128238216 [Mya arenaria]|uniref:uncharacterized protein LOC128238216 n=1 Tax=Mya arenaria TaxID=6604 RepID=UPI0022E91633|nr:uncharacterized protein LOC128238216 [Mya arenaria]